MTENVAIFLDFQNVHLTGHGLYGGGSERYRCVPDPGRLPYPSWPALDFAVGYLVVGAAMACVLIGAARSAGRGQAA